MRHLLTSLMLGSLLTSGPLCAQSVVTNLVTNPDFNTDVSGWSVQTGTPTFTLDTSSGDPAAPSARMVTSVVTDIFSDCIAIPDPTGTWEFAVNMRANSGVQPHAHLLAYSDANCTTTAKAISSLAGSAAAGTWATLSNPAVQLPGGTGGVGIDLSASDAMDANYDHVVFGMLIDNATHIDQPPQLLFNLPVAGTPAWGSDKVDPISFHLQSRQGGGSICYHVADVDSESQIETATIQLQGCTSSVCQLEFTNDVNGQISSPAPNVYTVNDPVNGTATQPGIDNLLNCFGIQFQNTSAAIGTISITVNDNGNSGVCSATNANPCSKTATAIVPFDAYSGATRDRIFLNGFEPF